jgi:putative DNA primase/helicase
MDFVSFCRERGVMIDSVPPIGQWVRFPTVDHPRSKNGAVKFMGDIGFVQNHAMDVEVSVWKSSIPINRVAIARIQKESKLEADKRNTLASNRAKEIIKESSTASHPYLIKKGFDREVGYVYQGSLVIPMRIDSQLVGVQLIGENGEKKFLYGQRTNDAEFIMDNRGRHIHCEGYATGLSIQQALRSLKIKYTIHVCFSANNLLRIAKRYGGVVVADNDESGTGEKVAKETGLKYWMSDQVKEDANDYHLRVGTFRFSQALRSLVV